MLDSYSLVIGGDAGTLLSLHFAGGLLMVSWSLLPFIVRLAVFSQALAKTP